MSARSSTQVARMLELVPYLQRRDGIHVDEVAADFGVPAKQIVADLKALWFCGLPGLLPGDLIEVDVDALDGEGIIRLSNAEFLDRPRRLEPTEALALIVALRGLREYCGPQQRDAVNRALAKLEAAAGESAAPADVVEVQADPGSEETNAAVEQALQENRRVHLTYYVPSRDETTERDADPMRVLVSGGRQYLEAWCHRAQETRLFRFDRILSATVLDAPAEPPVTARRLDLSDGIYQPDPADGVAVVELAASARWVVEYFPLEDVTELSDGRLRVSLRYNDPRWVEQLILRLGGQAHVIEPDTIAEGVRATAAEALAQYGET